MTPAPGPSAVASAPPAIGLGTAARSGWIDVAKGLGILLVVYGHVARGLANSGIAIDPGWFATLDALIYAFHMPLFFLLSGWFFLSSLARRGPRDYLATRVATVLWPYVLWSLLQGGIELAMSRWTRQPLAAGEVLALAWAPRAQFWFLHALFLISLVALALCARRPRAGVPALLAIGLVTHFLQQVAWPTALSTVASMLVYFAAGAWLGARGWGDGVLRRLALAGVLGGAVALGLVLTLAPSPPGDWVRLSGLIASGLGIAATCGLALVIAARPGGLARGLASLGRASMAIFLAHILVASGVRILLAKGLHLGSPSLHLLLGVVAGTLLPWWLWQRVQGRAGMVLFELPPAWRRRLAGEGAGLHGRPMSAPRPFDR